jgi:hypothetical protein
MADATVEPPHGIHGEQLATWQLAGSAATQCCTETPSGRMLRIRTRLRARSPQDPPDEHPQ